MNLLILFFKKTYKILIFVLVVIISFWGYNTYLIDHSLINLRVALDKVMDVKTLDEAKRLEPFLRQPILKEISKRELDAKSLAELEFTKDILAEPKDMDQLEEVKTFLVEVIQMKVQKRRPIFSALDRISSILNPRLREISILTKRRQAGDLMRRIPFLKDIDELQEAYFDLGNIYVTLDDFSKAKEAFSEVIELDKKIPLGIRAKFNLAWTNKMQGRFDEAISNFEELTQEQPGTEMAIGSKYQIASVYQKKGEFEKGISIYSSISEEHPESRLASLAEFQAGYVYLYDLKEPQPAIEIFSKIKGERPKEFLAKHIESKTELRIAKGYRNTGYRLLSQGHYIEAIKHFALALKINPKDGESYIGEGLAHLWLGERDLALDRGRKGRELAPSDEITSINLGFIYIHLGMLEEAISEYKRFISLNPRSAKAHYNLGYAYTMGGDFDKAIQEFRIAADLDPKFAFAYNNLGYVFWEIKNYAEAVKKFQQAIKIKPDYLDGHFNLGIVYRMQGRYEDAKKEFKEVLKIRPMHAEALKNLKELDDILGHK